MRPSNSAQAIVLDPSPFFRKGISACLETGGYMVLTCAPNLDEIMQRRAVLLPNLALVGPNFSEHESLVICRELLHCWPMLRIVLFSPHAKDLLFQVDVAHTGASACLLPETSEQECLSTIATVMTGHNLFSREILSLAFQPMELTTREREVLQLLAEGKTDREIADALVLSLNTVRKHSHRILGKLGVCERREAVRRARRLGWV